MSALSDNSGLDETLVDPDPINQFQLWFADAIAAKVKLPEAMTLATASRDGRPTARMVLLKQVDQDGFVFFTNYRSTKARQLDVNPYAALVFYWPPLDRQVRVEGSASKVSANESTDYFQTRPRESQIGAWASEQSDVIASREVLEQRAKDLESLYFEREIDRPDHWGGYRLKPDRIEFWISRIGRLHDRILYQRDGDAWLISRLAP